MSGIEKRKKTRVTFSTEVVLRTDKSEIQSKGSSIDLSMKGIFIDTDKELMPGTVCSIEILLTGSTDSLQLKMEGKVVRNEERGLAVSFEKMGLDTYTHLKNIVRYNTDNPDDVF